MQLFTGASSSELQHFHYTQGSCFASFSQQKKAKLLWDTAEVWPAAFYPKIICIQWKVVQVWGSHKAPSASIWDTRGKHCWVGKVFDCSSLISSQSGHSLCLFIPVLLLWKDFFFFLIPSWDSAPSPSGWVFSTPPSNSQIPPGGCPTI